MKIAFFDCHNFERGVFEEVNQKYGHQIQFLDLKLKPSTAPLAKGCDAVCVFVNDQVDQKSIQKLAENQVRLVALRCAGFNHVDLRAARDHGIQVVRVPEYSPHAVAEHTVALMLSLNRKIHRAYNRVRELNFSLDGLVGFDLYQKKVGIIGMGRIGQVLAKILHGFGCEILAVDKFEDQEAIKMGVRYVSLDELIPQVNILTLTVPLTPETHHLINAQRLSRMKKGVMIINTGRGGLIDTQALIQSLKSGHVGSAGLDVYEEEESIFFKDFSVEGLQDDVLARLLTFPNVLLTSHQGFLTQEALRQIAITTLENCASFEGGQLMNEVKAPPA